MKFDSDRAERFVSVLRASLSDGDAAAYAGISLVDLRRWTRDNRQFAEQVAAIKAERQVVDIGRVRRAAQTDWRASFALAQLGEAERELTRLRELTTD